MSIHQFWRKGLRNECIKFRFTKNFFVSKWHYVPKIKEYILQQYWLEWQKKCQIIQKIIKRLLSIAMHNSNCAKRVHAIKRYFIISFLKSTLTWIFNNIRVWEIINFQLHIMKYPRYDYSVQFNLLSLWLPPD